MAKNNSILGTFSGECADSAITNLNGMDISREVFEKLFESDEYKKALECKQYIGFLGHPEDPDCQDYKDACITMTDCRIDDDGKVYGDFDLIDTPTGRVVKAFIDAGVKFGISIRGAGDLIGNSVDPDTFVFRGFDLVSFPAYPDAIPTFTEIAASTDMQKRKKYQKVCKSLKDNLSSITSSSAIDVMKSQFAPQSDEYKSLQDREDELSKNSVVDIDDDMEEIYAEKVRDLVDAYVEEHEKAESVLSELDKVRKRSKDELDQSQRVSNRIKRIASSQLASVKQEVVKANKQIDALKSKIIATRTTNLIYEQEIEKQKKKISEQTQIISSLKSYRSETVVAKKELQSRTSNLDAENKKLMSEKASLEKVIASYQDAFASLYALNIGANLNDSVTVTASTSVQELKSMINKCSHGKQISKSNSVYASASIEDVADNDENLICL